MIARRLKTNTDWDPEIDDWLTSPQTPEDACLQGYSTKVQRMLAESIVPNRNLKFWTASGQAQ